MSSVAISVEDLTRKIESFGIVSDDSDYNTDDEKDNSEVLVPLSASEKVIYEAALKLESSLHPFSPFYTEPYTEFNYTRSVQALFDNYSHDSAIRFLAKSRVWQMRAPPAHPLPKAPSGVKAVRQFSYVDGTHALYRVVAEKEDKYILLACHQNVHGMHRGDLRFVEVNHYSKTNASGYSCIGHLALGDVLAVTELAKTEHMSQFMMNVDVLPITQESPCFWIVREATVLRRDRFTDVPFAFLTADTAVVMEYGQTMRVKSQLNNCSIQNRIFLGNGFLPRKMSEEAEFANGCQPWNLEKLQELTKEVCKYPDATGTIFTFKQSDALTHQFNVGADAFKSPNANSASILEMCAIMGSSAVTSLSSGHFDCRAFRMQMARKEGNLVRFCIENPPHQKTEGLWKCNTRIRIGRVGKPANAVIETAVVSGNGNLLQVVARLSREHSNFTFSEQVHMVTQREMAEGNVLQSGFFEELPVGCNARRIIETLYGGPSLDSGEPVADQEYMFPAKEPFKLNKFQSEYVTRILSQTPLTMASAPFGCGKSATIAAAAFYSLQRSRSQQLLITQSNQASVNLVDICSKFAGNSRPRFVRFVTENNWLEIPEVCQTDYDLPMLMRSVFKGIVTAKVAGGVANPKNDEKLVQMALYLKDRRLVKLEDLEGRIARKISYSTRRIRFDQLVSLFFEVFRPQIIISTIDSLPILVPQLTSVSTVQFDEASQVPESALLQVLSTFPNASFGLVGDVQQMPPYCEDVLSGQLKEFGIGSTMERAVTNRLFPQAVLRIVYRCHPKTTNLLGSLFYQNGLISGVEESDRNDFLKSRPDFWPNPRFPMLLVDNNGTSGRMGTSMSNSQELRLLDHIVSQLLKSVRPENIGIISFYKAQTALLTDRFRRTGIKCGTVDSFQGSEREVMVVCCTNERVSGFVESPNRVNVALSRAKQATVVVGNVRALSRSKCWRKVVKEAENHGSIVSGCF